MRTRDIDVLYCNIRKPMHYVPLAETLYENGYDYKEDVYSGVTKFYGPDGLEIEFLTKALGKGSPTQYIEPLKITAESLRLLDLTEAHSIKVHAKGYNILVPSPCVFVVHKILINPERLPVAKRAKDIDSCNRLLEYIVDDPDYCVEFNSIYDNLSKKQRKIFDQVVEERDLILVREVLNNNPDGLR